MTKRIDKLVVIYREEDSICEFCGKKAELRPYGQNRERICFRCAMEDEKMTEKRFNEVLTGRVESGLRPQAHFTIKDRNHWGK